MIVLGFLILLLFCALAFFVYKKSDSINDIIKKSITALVAILILCTGLEISLFNVNFYTTYNYEAIDLSHYLQDRKDKKGEYTIMHTDIVEFPELNEEIKNIHIDLGNKAPDTVDVIVKLTDDANTFYFRAPDRTLYKDVEKSQYFNIVTSGASEHLFLKFFSEDEGAFSVKSISINEKRPFEFSFVRLILLFAILVALYIFRPSSFLYKKRLVDYPQTKTSLVIGIVAIQCMIFIIIGTLNPAFLGYRSGENGGIEFVPLSLKHHNQYDELAQAILDGKTYIDNNDIPQSLLDLKNPYDTNARSQAQLVSGDKYRWDVAFYDGHYYVYFGIVPLLLMYLPFRAVMDAPFPSALGVILFACIFAIGVFQLLSLLIQKYFKKVSLGTYLIVALSFINCCGAMFLVKRPDFYSVPIICSMAFIIWGIFFWLKGKDATKKQNLYLTLGSLFCALSVGCRPQSVLMCAVALPIFWKFFFKDKHITSPKGIKNLVSLAVPFIIVASGIMFYNYIRFDSPFDFGSGYNLTTNDVTKRGFEIGRTGLGLFTYLFQPPEFSAVFPFIKKVDINTSYMGRTIKELCFGGLITCTPVLWFTGALNKVKNTLKEKNVWLVTLTALAVGFATVIADTQAGGLLQRYFSDFGYIFCFVTAMVIFALYEESNTKELHKFYTSLLYTSTILSAIYTFCLVFSVADVTIDVQRPDLFGGLKHLIEFWL